jgi:AAA domain
VSWNPVDLAKLPERAPVTPTIGGLVYPGRRHVFSGPPESAKTWAAFCIALEHIRAGGVVLHIDFEMFEYETRDRLRQMGATDDELARFLHVEPESEATEYVIGELMKHRSPTLAIIDAAAGAYGLQGLDDNSRRDAEIFAQTVIEPFRVRDVATVALDHVVKKTDNRKGFAIGSERKVGGADVHLGFDAVVPFGRGRTGLIRITTHKDRFGYLPRPRAAELELHSDPDTFAVSWQFKPADQSEDGFRPTVLMERVSKFLESRTDPASRNEIVTSPSVNGRAQYVRTAIDALLIDGFAAEVPGPRGAKLVSLLQPFTSSHLVPTSSGTNSSTSSLVPPSIGDEDEVDLGTASYNDLVRMNERGEL